MQSMFKRINSKKFPAITFFLSNRTKISNLETAAKTYGGATKNLDTNETWSNIAQSDYITVSANNTISLFIPDTINVNSQDANKQAETLQTITRQLHKKYRSIQFHKALGTWYSDDMQKVVYDNIIIVSVECPNVNTATINQFIKLAQYIKREMKQEGVSIGINDALSIV